MDGNGTRSAKPLMRAALAYARRGVPVFPCEARGKRPLTPDGFWDATTSERSVGTWWERWPSANLGVPTGARSRFLVLDVDPRAGGAESLAALEEAHGALPPTTRARTGGEGVHVYFRYPERTPGVEEVRNSASRVGPGLDVRGEGGYVLAPPSRTSFGAYEWAERPPPPPPPPWLLELMTGQRRVRPALWGQHTLF